MRLLPEFLHIFLSAAGRGGTKATSGSTANQAIRVDLEKKEAVRWSNPAEQQWKCSDSRHIKRKAQWQFIPDFIGIAMTALPMNLIVQEGVNPPCWAGLQCLRAHQGGQRGPETNLQASLITEKTEQALTFLTPSKIRVFDHRPHRCGRQNCQKNLESVASRSWGLLGKGCVCACACACVRVTLRLHESVPYPQSIAGGCRGFSWSASNEDTMDFL